MRIEEALVHRIENNATVAAIIDDRVYPLTRTQGDLSPAVTYQVVSITGLPAHDGASNLLRTRIQIDSWSRDRLQAHAIADALRDDLDGFRGTMGPAPGLGVVCLFDSSGESYEEVPELHRVRQDFFFTHPKP